MRRHIKGVISLLLCAVIIASIGVSALAALEVSAAPEETGDGTTILDSDAISAKVEALIKQYTDAGAVKESELAIAYTYLATGDSWYRNPDMWFYSASLYKVPLMMIMAEKESKGEIDQQTDIYGLPFSQVEKVVLVDSNNDYAHNTMKFLTGETEKKAFEKATRPMYQAYSSLPETYYHKDFVEYSYFTARFMNDVMCTLYNDQSRFPNIIDLLKQAMPDRYYHIKLGNQYEIAQKYGYYKDSKQNEWHNNTGIIFTPNPIVVTVMSKDAKKGEQFMGDVAELFVNYTLELDSKLASYKAEQERQEQERIAAEKAAAEAEAKAKEEEAARIAKEEADKKAAEEAALRAAEKEEKAAERKAAISKVLKYVGIAGAGVLVILIVVGILSSIRKRRALEEEEDSRISRRRGSDDDDDEDEEEFDEDEEEEDVPRKGGLGGLFRKKSAPARRRADDYDDDEDEDEEDIPPRKVKSASVAAMRRRAAVEEYGEEDEEEEDAEPTRISRMPVKVPSAPVKAQKAPVYEEEEEDEEDEAPAAKDDLDASLAYMKSAPVSSEDEEEGTSRIGFGRSKGGASGGYKPRH